MSLVMVTETMNMMEDTTLTMKEKEFVAQYAFRTGDSELVKKLIEELQEKDCDTEAVCTKYLQLADKKPEWVEQIENLLIALEMYRIEEQKAIRRITDFLKAHGVEITEENVKNFEVSEIKSKVMEAKNEEPRKEEAVPKAAVL